MKSRQKKFLSGLVAICCAAVLFVTGTFAWQAIVSAINPFAGDTSGAENGDNNPGGNLHDDFDTETGAKNIYVENTGTADIYVRVRLDEVLEKGSNEAPNPLVWKPHIPKDGDPANGMAGYQSAYENAFGWTMGNESAYAYQSIMSSDHWEPIAKNATKEQIEEVRTKNDSLIGDALGSATTSEGTIVDLNDAGKKDKTAPACEVITMAAYQGKSEAEKAAFTGWVYDVDGYAYWSQPLKDTETTGLLLREVKLPPRNSETYYYAINAVMEYVDIKDLPAWTEDDKDLISGEPVEDKPTDEAQDMLDNISNKLSANPSKVSVRTGESVAIPTITNSKGETVDPATLTWTSADDTKVSVDGNTGKINGLAVTGSPVTITGTNAYGKTVTISVTVANEPTTETEKDTEKVTEKEPEPVTDPAKKDLTAEDPVTDLNVGDKEPAPVVKDGDGNETAITEWESSDPDVVSVDPDTGEISANKPGEAVITGTDKDGNEVTYPVRVTDSLTADPASITMEAETSQALPAITNAKGESVAAASLTWTSTDEGKVKVENGKIVGITVTDTPVTLTGTDANGNKAKITVTVTGADRSLTAVNPPTALTVGDEANAPKVIVTGDASETPVTIKDWTSSNEAAVTVDPDTGKIKAVGEGSATITGSDTYGNEVSYTVTADWKDLTAEDPDAMNIGDTQDAPKVTDKDGNEITIGDWVSSDDAVVTVDPDTGELTATGKGEATISGTDKDGNPVEYVVTVTDKLNAASDRVSVKVDESTAIPEIKNAKDETVDPSTLTWTVAASDTGKIEVNKTTGTITGLEVTTEDVTLTGTDANGNSVQIKVTVIAPGAKKLTADSPDPVNIGATITAPKVTEEGDTTETPVNIISWESSDPAVAAVDKDGNVTAKGKGSAVITGEDKYGNKVTYDVEVTDELTADPSKVEIVSGKNSELPVIKDVNGDPVGASDLTWSSSDNTRVKVEDGKIVGVKATEDGKPVTVTATDKVGNKAGIEVTVRASAADKLDEAVEETYQAARVDPEYIGLTVHNGVVIPTWSEDPADNAWMPGPFEKNYGIIPITRFLKDSEHATNVTFSSNDSKVVKIEDGNIYVWYLPSAEEVVANGGPLSYYPEAAITATYTDPVTKETASKTVILKICLELAL